MTNDHDHVWKPGVAVHYLNLCLTLSGQQPVVSSAVLQVSDKHETKVKQVMDGLGQEQRMLKNSHTEKADKGLNFKVGLSSVSVGSRDCESVLYYVQLTFVSKQSYNAWRLLR